MTKPSLPPSIIINFGIVVANPDYYSVLEDGTLSVSAALGVLLNDFATFGSLEALSFTDPGHGALSVAEDGSLVYTADAGYVGIDTFTYTAGNGVLTQTGTVTVDVFQPLLTAESDIYVAKAGQVLDVSAAHGLLVDDITTGGTIEATNFTETSHGTLSLGENGSFSYTPDPGFVGDDTFTYYISNGYGTASATDTIDVVDGTPVANTDHYVVRAGQTLTVNAAAGVLANDIDPGGTLTATNFTDAAHGTVSLDEDGGFDYTPDVGFVGTDTFTYYVSDGSQTASATATVSVVDSAPVAAPDFYHVDEDGTLTVAAAAGVLHNDFDPDGDALVATNFTSAEHGTFSLGENGSFSYMPDPGFIGTDAVTYYISDGALPADATVQIQVGLAGTFAKPDTYSVFEGDTLDVTAADGVLANDYSTSRGGLIATNFTDASHGTVSLAEDGSFTYNPNAGFVGADTFTYYIADGAQTASAVATIDVIQPALQATADVYVMKAGGTLAVSASKGVLANDISTGGTIEATNFTDTSHGTLSLGENGSFSYTPDVGYVGDDTFTYYISNGSGTASATDTIDVVDAPPVANKDYYATRAGKTLTVSAAEGVLANDADPGGTVIATNFTDTSHGTVSLGEDGSFSYTPDAGFVGSDGFTYYISDGTQTASATATISVVDSAPVAEPDFYHVAENQALTVTPAKGVLLNDFDPDGDALTATNFTSASHGTVSLGEVGSFVYTPDAGFTGTDTFTYYISDGTLPAHALVSLQVMACYCTGTRILTEHGEVPVEALVVGDRVRTHSRELRTVTWIGWRELSASALRRTPELAPIRIRRGTVADGVPHRDLLVSPDHGICVDGLLVPARLLVNGMTILPHRSGEPVTYWHVEVEDHAILLAEGLAAESYLDTGNRSAFENGGSSVRLHPDFAGDEARRRAGSCVLLCVEPARTEPLWRRLAARAQALGHAPPTVRFTDDPAVQLLVDGRALAATSVLNRCRVYILPRVGGEAFLVSRASAPCEAKPWLDDRRRLGVSVSRIILHGGNGPTDVAMDDPRIVEGWHGAERDGNRLWRWTGGRARLPVLNDTLGIELHLAGSASYPADVRVPLRTVSA
jgi:hypothetical protein